MTKMTRMTRKRMMTKKKKMKMKLKMTKGPKRRRTMAQRSKRRSRHWAWPSQRLALAPRSCVAPMAVTNKQSGAST
jgi:hypothetical protein